MTNKIILLIGPAGVGKTTASALLAKKFKRSAVIEVDRLRHSIKSGYISPFTSAGRGQLELSTKNTCLLSKSFVDAGFNVIIDDCVTDKARLDLYYRTLKKYKFLTILLFPNKNVIKKRDGNRTGSARMGERAFFLHDKFTRRILEEKRWFMLDNSHLTPTQTVNDIYKIIKAKL